MLFCLSSGLGWRFAAPPLAIMAFMGFEWSFSQPLHVGDTVRSRAMTANLRSLRDAGVVIEERDIVDQRGQVAQRIRITLMVAKRPGKEP
jgi:acyl dehydratase